MLIPLLFTYGIAQEPMPTAGALISKMLARYASARSLSGKIRTTQTAGSFTILTDTVVAYERPSKLLIDQKQKGVKETKDRWTRIVSDGIDFAYTPPNRVLNSAPFLREKVQPEGRQAQTVPDLYTVVASDLPDRSPLLDAVIARREDMEYFANQLATFAYKGKTTLGDRSLNLIEGSWRETPQNRKGGDFKILLSDDGDLVRYVLVQNFASPAQGSRPGQAGIGAEQVVVTTTWDASITVGTPVAPETFALKIR